MNLGNRYSFKVILLYLHYYLQYYYAYSQQVIFNHGIGENEFIVSSVKLSYNQCLTRFNSYTGHANTMVYKRRFSMCYMHFVCGTFEHVQEPGSVLAHRSMIEAKDCLELYEMGWREDGTYTIKPDGSTCIRTWCDMTNGGWTVIQRRMNGRENFYRTWEEYVRGFGHVSGEYWLGLDNIFALTIYDSSLTIKMEAFGDISPTHAYANYQQFKIDDESSNFLLHVSGFSGDCGDSFSFQNGEMFTTKDRDNDQWDGNCAQTYEGAWWYKMCHYSNLNGRYLFGNHSSYANGVNWRTCWGYQYSIRTSVMQIRRT